MNPYLDQVLGLAPGPFIFIALQQFFNVSPNFIDIVYIKRLEVVIKSSLAMWKLHCVAIFLDSGCCGTAINLHVQRWPFWFEDAPVAHILVVYDANIDTPSSHCRFKRLTHNHGKFGVLDGKLWRKLSTVPERLFGKYVNMSSLGSIDKRSFGSLDVKILCSVNMDLHFHKMSISDCIPIGTRDSSPEITDVAFARYKKDVQNRTSSNLLLNLAGSTDRAGKPLLADFLLLGQKLEKLGFTFYKGRVASTDLYE